MRPELRDCPFCHTKGNDDEKLFFMHNQAMLNDGSHYTASYSIFCTVCGVEMTDEYEDDLAHRWNGTSPETEGGAA